MDTVEKVVAAVLYEGYVLWPYRRSAHKNQQRWTLGGVYPRGHSEACGNSDPWLMQTQCLVTGAAPVAQVKVRFLHVVERRIARQNADGTRDFVDELCAGSERYLAWEEAAEREIRMAGLNLTELSGPRRAEIAIPEGCEEEPLTDDGGEVIGALTRSWHALQGLMEIEAEPLAAGLFRLTVRVTNTTPWSAQERRRTLRQTFVSAHTILTVENGGFVSLMDPPPALKEAAAQCENIKTWPVLGGQEGETHALLSSPIILYDYPQVAPESPGDMFDGREIDQLLLLNILMLTDEEKSEMRATDPRAREILERTEAMNTEDFMNLHGAIRDFRVLNPEAEAFPVETFPVLENPFAVLDGTAPQSVIVDGVELRAGSRVRLRPRAGRDVMDFALAGKVARVESVEQDYEDRVHLTVTLEGDPGRDMGKARYLGHRFFFEPEEVEPLNDEEGP